MFDTFQADFARDRALALIDERGSDLHENVLIHADAGGKLILVLMSQMSLRGYFGGPPSDVESAPAKLTLAEWNQVVDHNIDAFRRIAFSMLRSGRPPPRGRCVDAGQARSVRAARAALPRFRIAGSNYPPLEPWYSGSNSGRVK